MTHNIVYVVGDKFKNFASNDNVLTFTDFVETLFKNKDKNGFDYVLIGQGLNKFEKKIISLMATREKLKILNEEDINFASSEITHKHKAENIFISDPIKITDKNVYLSKLLIDDSCAEMSDHATGQHIQGMILTEAARQMMLSVAEKYLLNPEHKNNSYCVLLKVCSNFIQFNFPIETTIKHIVLDLKSKQGRYASKTKTEIYQNNEIICEVDIDYIFCNKSVMEAKECSLAKSSLKKNIEITLDEIRLPLTA